MYMQIVLKHGTERRIAKRNTRPRQTVGQEASKFTAGPWALLLGRDAGKVGMAFDVAGRNAIDAFETDADPVELALHMCKPSRRLGQVQEVDGNRILGRF